MAVSRVLVPLGLAASGVILLAAAAPFIPLPGTMPIEELAVSDSHFVTISGISVHYKAAGEGPLTLLLLHGFAASTFSWEKVTRDLATGARVVAFDRPGFGITERPLPGSWRDANPYALSGQADLTVGLMDALGIERAVLVGHSAGGAVAVQVALAHPGRVAGMVLVNAAVYEGGPPPWATAWARLPLLGRLGPLLVRPAWLLAGRALRSAWYRPSQATPEVLEAYRTPLRAQHWDIGLWQLVRASEPLRLAERLVGVRAPTLVVASEKDAVVPMALSRRLAGDLPGAELAEIYRCGHVPQEECPAEFLAAVLPWLARTCGTP